MDGHLLTDGLAFWRLIRWMIRAFSKGGGVLYHGLDGLKPER